MLPAQLGGIQDAKSRALEWLQRVGLQDRLGHFPNTLSGGEQQRVAIARAIAGDTKILLADEPTGNLDTSTGEDLFQLLLKLNRDRDITFVIVTHNESLSQRCHRVLRMVDGRLQ